MDFDRNEIARQQFAAQQQIRARFAAFAGDYAAGKIAVLDRLGARVEKQDLVVWRPPHDMVYEVVDIQPVLEPVPGQPIGMVMVVLGMNAPVNFVGNQPAMSLIKIGRQVQKDAGELYTPQMYAIVQPAGDGAVAAPPDTDPSAEEAQPPAPAEAPEAPEAPADGDSTN